MQKVILLSCFLFYATMAFAQNQAPVITNLTASVDWPSNTLTLSYDVSDEENDPFEVIVQFSDNGGKTYALTNQIPVSGDVGFPVQPGSRSITCAVDSLAGMAIPFTVRLVADDKQVFDIQKLVNEVDSNRLRANLEFVEGIRHRTTGLAHLNEVRDSLKNCFQNARLFFEEQTFTFSNTTGRNLLGILPGTSAAEKSVIVDAHYDSVSNAPGADDNGSGTVGVMEIARLLSRYPAKKTMRFIGFDLEESGLIGSINYVTNGIPAGEQIEGVFNFEMIGYYSDEPNTQQVPSGFCFLFPNACAQLTADEYRGNFLANVSNTASQPLELLLNNSAQQYVPDLKVISVSLPGNGQIAPDFRRSDHAPFWDTGKKALMLTDGANFRNECYHTPGDTLDDKLNFTFMSNVVKATLAAMAQLAEIQHADWATTTFQGVVSISETSDCQFTAWYDAGSSDMLNFTVVNCLYTPTHVEILDEKGSLLHSETLALNDGEQQYGLLIPRLSPGMYFAKINWPEGMRTQKFVVSR